MKYFAVSYQYDPESPAIAQHRPEHRKFIEGLSQKGLILGSGPHPDSTGGALIILSLESADAETADVTKIMDQDPFWAQGAVTKRSIRQWKVVTSSF